jgi:hypothetical protein
MMENKSKRVLSLFGGHALLIAAMACSAPSELDARNRVVVKALELPSRPLIEASSMNAAVLGLKVASESESSLSLDTLAVDVAGNIGAVTQAHLWLDVNANGVVDVDTDAHLSTAMVAPDGACKFTGLDVSLDVELSLLVAVDVGDDCEPGDAIAVDLDLESCVVIDTNGGRCAVEGEANGEVTVVADVDVCVDVDISTSIDTSIAINVGADAEVLAFSLVSAADAHLQTLALDVHGNVAAGLLADLVLDVDGDGAFTAGVDIVLAADASLSLDGCEFHELGLDLQANVSVDLLVVLKGTEACESGDVFDLSVDLDSTILISLDGNGACVRGDVGCIVTAIDINGTTDCGDSCGGSLTIGATSELDLEVSNLLAIALDASADVNVETLSFISMGSVNDGNVTLDLWLDVNGNGRIDVDVDVCLAVGVAFNADDGLCTFDGLNLFVDADARVELLVAVNINGASEGDTFGLVLGSDQCSATIIGTDINVDINANIDTGLCVVAEASVDASIGVDL